MTRKEWGSMPWGIIGLLSYVVTNPILYINIVILSLVGLAIQLYYAFMYKGK